MKCPLFNEYEFIKDPETEDDPSFWTCQDCKPDYNSKDHCTVRRNYICEECGSHTLGPFASIREAHKVYYASRGLWGLFKALQDEDGIDMPNFEEYFKYNVILWNTEGV